MPVTPAFFSFLVENRLHDSKAWFEAHREDYNRFVLEPLRGLVQEMAPVMLTLDPLLITQPAVGKTISRICGFPSPVERRSVISLFRSCISTYPPMAIPTAAAGTVQAPS